MKAILILAITFAAFTMTHAAASHRSGYAEVITFGPERAPGLKAGVSSVSSAGQSGSGDGSGSRSRSAGSPPARWVSSACLARPPWFGRVVVSWEAGTCLTGTPEENDPDAAVPSPQQLAWIAADRAMAVAERPELRISPGRVGLTGLRTYFWLDHVPPTVWATASVPGIVVTAEAYPIRYRWSFGEAPAKTTNEIGRAWSRRSPGTISHMYETRGRYSVGVEVVWQARWRVGRGGWMHLGYFSNSSSRVYPVRQMVGRLTRD